MSVLEKSANSIIKECLEHLSAILNLSRAISRSLENDTTDTVDSLFEKRGIEMQTIADLERELGQLIASDPQSITNSEIDQYKNEREKLFLNIQKIDRQLNGAIVASKEAVLSEMKELYRGRKMNDGYLNVSAYPSAFIDTKE